HHPHTMLATATHDSKRGEDTRLRIDALSEMPDAWRQHLDRWARLNQVFKQEVNGQAAPDANDEYLLYQTMLGAWSDDSDLVGRLCAAMEKSLREAKRHTSWSHFNPAYEQAVLDFVRRIAETDRKNPFLEDFKALQTRLSRLGEVYGLGQTLLKLTVPGVPDIYQGCELWQLALVDPDNRRPVDYARRRHLLDQAKASTADPASGWAEGLPKLRLIHRALTYRKEQSALFEQGEYRPLTVRGDKAPHVLAFARLLENKAVLVAVPLMLARLWPEAQRMPPLGAAWKGTGIEVPGQVAFGRFHNLLTGEELSPHPRRGAQVLGGDDVFRSFPVAMIEAATP
ncbi:MAG: malto-oligosyltrehalose synthase, partial [Rhodospirillales bacterium]|nr:malto-oligosyltrehalose synthase [Rhodospirillales bacterium]